MPQGRDRGTLGSRRQDASRSPWVSAPGVIRSGAAPAPVAGGSFLADHARIGAEGLPASHSVAWNKTAYDPQGSARRTTMTRENAVVAIYHTHTDAEAAVRELQQAG